MKNKTPAPLSNILPSLLYVESNIASKLGLKEAMILQQVHLWLQVSQNSKQKNGVYWVSKTYEQWKQLFPFWSTRTIQRAILNLEENGFIESYLSGGYRTLKHYRINYDSLRELGISYVPMLTNQDITLYKL